MAESIDEVTTLRAVVDRVESVFKQWRDTEQNDARGVLEGLEKALSLSDVQEWLSGEERSLPLIVQIMQAQYLSMTHTMNSLVNLAQEERLGIASVLVDLTEALDKHVTRLAGLGLMIDDDPLTKAVEAAHGEIYAARKAQENGVSL